MRTPAAGMPVLAAILGLAVAGQARAAVREHGALSAYAGALQARVPGLSKNRLLVPQWKGERLSFATPDSLDPSSPLTVRGRPVPAALDPRKAAILGDRALSLEGAGAALRLDDQRPTRIIERVNAVLQDLSPEALESMPAEDLRALASVIMDGFKPGAPARPRASLRGLSVISKARTESLLSKRGLPLDKNEPYKQVRDMQTVPVYVRGTPDTVQRIRPDYEEGLSRREQLSRPDAVFRHYTTEEALQNILAEKALQNSFLPYIELTLYVSRTFYEDLTGLFLTLPGVPGKDVGVPSEHTAYIDLRLPAGLPLVQPDFRYEIYLVPFRRRPFAGMAEAYLRWIRGEDLPPGDLDAVLEIEKEGGPGPELSVPVSIVGRSPSGESSGR